MIELKDVHKAYSMGGSRINALKGVSLTIEPGEFVAIMGPSGSGKSTLMHVLGLLDTPDTGSYRLDGREIGRLDEDALALLRRETIGFVFQQFHLLPRMTAEENVAIPLLYTRHHLDLDEAKRVLEGVGLGDRTRHRPNELSGGQQQRVAIARSLVNHPRIILADEPTGNLDSVSRNEILGALQALNDQGITIVIVTHEEEIGRKARRLIRLRDGVIQSDERLTIGVSRTSAPTRMEPPKIPARIGAAEAVEHIRQGFMALGSNKVRAGLSMLGILIGVAAVITMLALGRGAQKAIEAQLASLGSNLLVVRPGAGYAGGVALETGAVTRLTLEDAAALREKIPAIRDISPSISGRAQVTSSDKNWNTQVIGAGPAYARMRASIPPVGRFFTEEENHIRNRVAVIGATVSRELFGQQSPIGEMIKINKVNFQVIGILPIRGANTFRDQDDIIVIPVLTAMHRLLGRDYIDSIDVEVDTAGDMDGVENASKDLLIARHRIPPSQQQGAYTVRNMADVKEAMSQTNRTMSLLLASIAAISLLVGGIGIMNIMLVSVTERTREIGLRKSVGARRRDILAQFLAEAVVVTVVGGVMGIALGWILTEALSNLAGWATSISPASVLLAFFFSAAIGIIFGIYPARKASRLNPIDALRYE